jgi:hypothetical protein
MTTLGTSFPFNFVDLSGTTVGPPPFTIIPNPNFPDLAPVIVVRNLASPKAPDDFIAIGSVAGAPPTLGSWSFVGERLGPPVLDGGSLTHFSRVSVL